MSNVKQSNSQAQEVTRAQWLRRRITLAEPLVLPGAYDAVTSRLVHASGAEGVYVGGFASIASSFGLPDVGLVTGAELIGTYRRIKAATDLPMVVDIDTGYGNAANVRRTVEQVIELGVAGFHIEDQANPKRCGHLQHDPVVAVKEAAARVATAIATAERFGADAPVVIARTDALHTEGLDAAIERARVFRSAGADMIFVDAIPSVDAMKRIRDSVDGPLLFNAATTGRSPSLTVDRLRELGYSTAIYPIELLLSALAASRATLAQLGTSPNTSQWYQFGDLNALLGLPEVESWVARFPSE